MRVPGEIEMTDNVTPFVKPKPKKPPPGSGMRAGDVETIGFVTTNDVDFYIDDPRDILKIVAFIVDSGINVKRGEGPYG